MSAPPDRKPNDSLTSTIKDDNKRKLSFARSELRTSQLGSGNRNDNNSSSNNKSNQNPSHQQQQQQQQRAQQFNALLRNKPPAGSGGTPSDSTPAGSNKIDSDLVNVANENRVILNVGGIRHETYKVIECSHLFAHRLADTRDVC